MLPRPKRTLFVLATPRTGSSYFCQMIRGQTGVDIKEWFTQSHRPSRNKLTLDFVTTVSRLLADQSDTKTFGCKIMAGHLGELLEILPYDRFPEIFGSVSFARCIRDNTAAQAVSWAKADMDKVWMKCHAEHTSRPLNYDLDKLTANAKQRVTDIRNYNQFLDDFIATYNVPVSKTVRYENLLLDVNEAIRQIFSNSRIPVKQADDVNRIVLERLRA